MTLADLSTGETEADTTHSRNSSMIESFYSTLAGTRCQTDTSMSAKNTSGKSFDMSISRLETEVHGGDDALTDDDEREESKLNES